MKRNRIFGRLLALALTLGMALSLAPSLAVPARAAGEGQSPQIIIKSNKFVSTPEDDAAKINSVLKTELETRFWAYQIFIGEIDEEDYVANRDINSLSGTAIEDTSGQKAIQWGDSIQTGKQEELLEALGKDDTPASELGVTFVLMLETGERYLDKEQIKDEDYPFKSYTEAYYTESNWQPSDDSSTEGAVGGELTTAGRAALEDAFNKDLETLTIGALFKAALDRNVGNEIITNGAYTASMIIADFTPATGNVTLAQAFYAIVFDKDASDYKYLKNSGGEAKGAPEGSNTDNKYEGAYAVSRWISNGTDGYWGIGTMNSDHTERTLEDGYYMIRDAYSEAYDEDKNNIGKASAAYMAGVYGYGTIDPKAEAPSVTKTIYGSGSGASRELGETITFTLEGSLPENYFTAYKGYPYIFEDTMAPGLTFGGITRVYVMVPDGDGKFGYLGNRYDYYLVEEAVNVTGGNTGQGYRLTKPDRNNNNKLTISFPNLQNVKGKKVVPTVEDQWSTENTAVTIPVNNDSEVYVVYTAALNEGANITDITASNTGNRNTVVLRYANEPLWDPEASGGSWDENWEEAPKGMATETVYLYVFGVQLTVYGKKDDGEAETPTAEPNTGETEEREPLAGAGFALKKSEYDNASNKTKDYYAVLHQVKGTGSGPNTPDTYYLAGWVSEDDLYTYMAGDTLTRTTKSWGDQLAANAAISGLTVPDTGDYYTAVITQSDGRVRIVGLDGNSTYYLEEVITPEGWAAVDDISISFTAAHNSSGILTDLTATATGADYEKKNRTILSNGNFGNGYSELVALLIIEQEPADEIVDTGGMGNTLFYIGGGALLIGAALLLIIMNVKKPEKRDR